MSMREMYAITVFISKDTLLDLQLNPLVLYLIISC